MVRLCLSPSSLTYLWDDCPRCFYLQAHRRLSPPRLPFPGIFARIHEALQAHFEDACPSSLDASLPTGRCVNGECWVESAPAAATADLAVTFRGRLDHLLEFDDGTFGIVDYKTIALTPATRRRYNRQLHAYAYALEHPAPGAERRAPITRMGLLCLEPARLAAYERGASAHLELRPSWVELPRDDDAFQRFLARVLALLGGPLPAPGTACAVCAYLHRHSILHPHTLNA